MVCDLNRSGVRDRKIAASYRVVADGKDITGDVNYVDARRRIVRIFLRNANGSHYLATDHGIADKWIKPRRVRMIRKNNGHD